MEKEEIKKMILAKKEWRCLNPEESELFLYNHLFLKINRISIFFSNRWAVRKPDEPLKAVEYFKIESEARAFCEAELEKYVDGLLS